MFDLASQDGSVVEAIAYGAELHGSAANFKVALKHAGFVPKYKTVSTYPTITGRNCKADWDVGIAVDVIEKLDKYDKVIFGTADGDLAPCLEYVKARGKETKVIGCGISRNLKAISNWQEITEGLLE